MSIITLPPMPDVPRACRALRAWVGQLIAAPQEGLCLRVGVQEFDGEAFFSSIAGAARAYFRSRDQDLELCGLGVAHNLSGKWACLLKRAARLEPDQFYMGGTRFDVDGDISSEWQAFGRELFFLPLLQVTKRHIKTTLMLNYEPDGPMPFHVWRDQALSLLETQAEPAPSRALAISLAQGDEQPGQMHYVSAIDDAKAIFLSRPECRKVVLGRRNTQIFSHHIDPIKLFYPLAKASPKGFSFLLDAGGGAVFFGVSPELLYRRFGRNFETESLAGTRPRSRNEHEDARLQQELYNSFKDQVEHALVSEHIEQRLAEFGATDLFTSRLEVMALPFVQHLVKRYHGNINAHLGDDQILRALHPTPAVCGLEQQWALNFIRDHEGFDRGFYAGPIGYIGQDQAEFAVAIRSALYWEQKLYVYAACGIVPESQALQEWEELNNKQKNIMSIFNQPVAVHADSKDKQHRNGADKF